MVGGSDQGRALRQRARFVLLHRHPWRARPPALVSFQPVAGALPRFLRAVENAQHGLLPALGRVLKKHRVAAGRLGLLDRPFGGFCFGSFWFSGFCFGGFRFDGFQIGGFSVWLCQLMVLGSVVAGSMVLLQLVVRHPILPRLVSVALDLVGNFGNMLARVTNCQHCRLKIS